MTQTLPSKDLKPTFLGKLAYYCFPMRRNVIFDNMQIVYGDSLDMKGKKRLAQCYYSHLVKLLIENIRVFWQSDEELKKQVKVFGADIPIQFARKGVGTILLGSHLGNWEVGPVGAVLNYPEFQGKMHIMRRAIVNKAVEKILFSRYYRVGLNIIPKKNSVDQVLEALERFESVGFIMDQYAKPGRDGILVEFFGKKAGTFRSMALVASSTKCPVIPSLFYRELDGTHVMQFFDPVPLIEKDDPDEETYLNTLAYNKVLEGFILSHPDQWNWLHKRWKEKKSVRGS